MPATSDHASTEDILCHSCEYFSHAEEQANKAREIYAIGVRAILTNIEKRRTLAANVAAHPELFAGTPESQVQPVTVEEIEKSLANLSARAMRAWKGKN